MNTEIQSFSDDLKILTYSQPARLNIGYIQGTNGHLLVDSGSSNNHASLIKSMIPAGKIF